MTKIKKDIKNEDKEEIMLKIKMLCKIPYPRDILMRFIRREEGPLKGEVSRRLDYFFSASGSMYALDLHLKFRFLLHSVLGCAVKYRVL